MKVLNIVRHAKSSWDNANLDDFDRPLNKRGIHNTEELSRVLDNAGAKIDFILSSSAKRAHTTAELIARHLERSNPMIVTQDDLYHANPGLWIDSISNIDDKFSEIMIVGHQPTLSALTDLLVNDRVDHVITCSCSRLIFDIDSWNDLGREKFTGGVHYNRHHWEGLQLN